MKFYYHAILSITYLWGVVVAHRDASMRSMQNIDDLLPDFEAGEFSVVILGFDNIAPGKFCNVNGGKGNVAGRFNDYAIIGGGVENDAGSTFSTITGGRENLITRGAQKDFFFDTDSTISGGSFNGISNDTISSVITGGNQNKCVVSSVSKGCTISGGQTNRCKDEYAVATGGFLITADNVAAVAFGGINNEGNGISATSVGGELNNINGDFSIGLGLATIVDNDSSMVICLNPSLSSFCGDTDVDGQFLVNAESYTFQIGKNRDGLSSFQITEDNIENLITALENAA